MNTSGTALHKIEQRRTTLCSIAELCRALQSFAELCRALQSFADVLRTCKHIEQKHTLRSPHSNRASHTNENRK
jgi:hypothetical protein